MTIYPKALNYLVTALMLSLGLTAQPLVVPNSSAIELNYTGSPRVLYEYETSQMGRTGRRQGIGRSEQDRPSPDT
jgi:hypothetical protein